MPSTVSSFGHTRQTKQAGWAQVIAGLSPPPRSCEPSHSKGSFPSLSHIVAYTVYLESAHKGWCMHEHIGTRSLGTQFETWFAKECRSTIFFAKGISVASLGLAFQMAPGVWAWEMQGAHSAAPWGQPNSCKSVARSGHPRFPPVPQSPDTLCYRASNEWMHLCIHSFQTTWSIGEKTTDKSATSHDTNFHWHG